MAFAETANLAIKLTLGGNFQSQLAKARAGLKGLDRETRGFKAGAQIGTGIKNIGRLAVVAAASIGGLAVATAKAAGDFEAQLNTINTVARATPPELKQIGDAIRKIARDTGTTTDDLTAGYYDLVSAGIKAADATKVLTAANTLAIGGLSTTAEAVDLLTTAINTYGGDASKAGEYTDVFAKAIERGKVTAAELAQSFAQVGPIAASSKIEIKELAAGYARLTAAGVPAAEASTQMRSAIIALTRTTKPLEKLQAATGRNYLKIAGKKGLVFALQQMRKDAEKAGVPLIDLLGRVEGLNFTLATTGPNFDAYNADLAAMSKSTGTASAQMAERQKGLNFQLARLKALAHDAGISIGSALLPKLTPLLEKLNAFVSGTEGQKAIKDIGDALAGLFTKGNITAGIDALKGAFQVAKDAAPAIAGAAKITGAALKVAVDAFNALPKEIQSLAIAGLAVNKLTGGLVTNLAGGLISAVISSFKGMMNVNAAVVNVNGAVGGLPGGGINPVATGAGLTGAAALGIGGGAVFAGLIGAVNSPLWVRNTTLSAKLEQQGLTQAERAAQQYYRASSADQAQMRKHILVLPTRAEFESGNAKLSAAVRNAATADSRASLQVEQATRRGAATTAAAVRASRPIVTTNVKVSVSGNSVNKVVTVTGRYGQPTGSRNQNNIGVSGAR